VKCRERTLRKIAQTMPTEEELIGVEDQWLEEHSSMLGARERDGEETEITTVSGVIVVNAWHSTIPN